MINVGGPKMPYIVIKEIKDFARVMDPVFVLVNEKDEKYIVLKDFKNSGLIEDNNEKIRQLDLNELNKHLVLLSDLIFYCECNMDIVWMKSFTHRLCNALKKSSVRYYDLNDKFYYHFDKLVRYGCNIDISNNLMTVNVENVAGTTKFKTLIRKIELKKFCKKNGLKFIRVNKLRKEFGDYLF